MNVSVCVGRPFLAYYSIILSTCTIIGTKSQGKPMLFDVHNNLSAARYFFSSFCEYRFFNIYKQQIVSVICMWVCYLRLEWHFFFLVSNVNVLRRIRESLNVRPRSEVNTLTNAHKRRCCCRGIPTTRTNMNLFQLIAFVTRFFFAHVFDFIRFVNKLSITSIISILESICG